MFNKKSPSIDDDNVLNDDEVKNDSEIDNDDGHNDDVNDNNVNKDNKNALVEGGMIFLKKKKSLQSFLKWREL